MLKERALVVVPVLRAQNTIRNIQFMNRRKIQTNTKYIYNFLKLFDSALQFQSDSNI